MYALEAIRYVPEAQYNLIFIRVLDEERCQIQVQQGVVTVSQGEDNPERREVWRIIQAEGRKLSLRMSFKDKLGREFIAGGALRKIATRRESCQSVVGEKRMHSGKA